MRTPDGRARVATFDVTDPEQLADYFMRTLGHAPAAERDVPEVRLAGLEHHREFGDGDSDHRDALLEQR